ncbi:MAG: hypothetical protein JXQ26_00175 [Tissierellales bacterium]|nr:hypothetical protein [Tissierellales bacterium]MBN2826371.1 hypothetical protein [Tissierellales bacterium]
MKKIYSMLILSMIIIGITLHIFKIKEISHVESFVINSYLNELKEGTTNTKYTLSEKDKLHSNDDVIKRFNIAGRRINIEKLSGFLQNADYLYYKVEKRSSITKKFEEYNDKYLKRFVVFYFPSVV